MTAQNVPGVGYKVYSFHHNAKRAQEFAAQNTLNIEDFVVLEAGQAKSGDAGKKPTVDTTTTVLESPFYKIKLDPATGTLSSIYDKQLNRELVDVQSPYRFGQYLYVTGGDGGGDKKLNGILQYQKPKPDLQIHTTEKGHIVGIRKTPYGWSAKLESSATNTPMIDTEIRLFDAEKKIEFIEDVTKTEVYQREGVYFAFPFAMSHPQFQFEIQNGVIDPQRTCSRALEWTGLPSNIGSPCSRTDFRERSCLLIRRWLPSAILCAAIGRIPSALEKGTIFAFVLNNYHQPRR